MTPSPADVIVLLAVRLAGRATADRVDAVARHLGGPGDVGARLDAAVEEGRVRVRGQERRHSLTPAGEAELSGLLAAQTDAVGRADVMVAYKAFLPLNRRVLALLGSEADAPRLAALAALVDELRPVLASLEDQLSRFGRYGARFELALQRAGDDDAWIESPAVDSVHTVWFELHEHLLATLGRDRTSER